MNLYSGLTYINLPLLFEHVKSVVQQKTTEGGGQENGITVDEIFREIEHTFNIQYGYCPISRSDIINILNLQVNGRRVFYSDINGVHWRVYPTQPQTPIYFEPISIVDNHQHRSIVNNSVDYEMMLYSESDLINEIELLQKRKNDIIKANDKLRQRGQLLTNPALINTTLSRNKSYLESMRDTYLMIEEKTNNILDLLSEY